jgi:hypothetical protein
MNNNYQNPEYNNIHYGENDNEYFIDIQAKTDELQLTWDNHKKFKQIMKNLEREVMGGYISDENLGTHVPKLDSNYIQGLNGNIIEKPRPMLTPVDKFKQGVMGNISNTVLTMNNMNLINNRSNTGYLINPIERSHSPLVKNRKAHKKYTDVHANSKYYYPTEMNGSFDELMTEQSQWNDRSNRNTLYNPVVSTSYSETRRNYQNRSFYDEDVMRDNSGIYLNRKFI